MCGRKNVKVKRKRKKNEISMGDEKCKSQEKKKKEKKWNMKYESSLEYCGKRKRWYKVV